MLPRKSSTPHLVRGKYQGMKLHLVRFEPDQVSFGA